MPSTLRGFLSLEDARAKIEAWRLDYNESRPHSSLGGQDASGIRPDAAWPKTPDEASLKQAKSSPSGRT